MSAGKRSFAERIQKQNNQEVRRRIWTSLSCDTQSRPHSSLSFYSVSGDQLEGIDFEEYVASNGMSMETDDCKQLLDFPSDDIEVCIVPKKIRTAKRILPEFQDLQDQEDTYINECIDCYTSNWVVVNRRYENNLSYNDRRCERLKFGRKIGCQEYEIDREAKENRRSRDSGDWSPNAYETPTTISSSRTSSRPQSLVYSNLTNVRPPLASDEDTSEGSLTPPYNGTSNNVNEEDETPKASKSVSGNTSRNNSVGNGIQSARDSWRFIDSPCSDKLSRCSTISRSSRVVDLRNSQPDPLVNTILDSIAIEDVDRLNEAGRTENRHPSLFLLYPIEDSESGIEYRYRAQPPKEHLGHRMLVNCLSLKMDLEIEPIFASMALYDAKAKKKISENFYFDMNPDHIKRMLSSHIPYQDISTLSKSCIFNISFPCDEIYLVIKLEKVLQGDLNEFLESYTKDERNRERLKSNAPSFCERLGKYRQMFAWTAVYLMDIFNGNLNGVESHDLGSLDRRTAQDAARKRSRDSASLSRKDSFEKAKLERSKSIAKEELDVIVDKFHPVTITMKHLFYFDHFNDDDLCKYLQELRKSSSSIKRLKTIPGFLKLDISPTSGIQPKYCLTPELVKVNPYPDESQYPVKELLEFPQKEICVPNYHYRNLLYIYPKALNFSNRPGSARNITCRVQLLPSEDEHSALPVIFGRSGCPEFVKEAYFGVSYHNKCPEFNDEIKIKLPAKLSEQHHLFFTFYHISCQRNKQNDASQTIETPLGYTWLPLYRDGRLQTGPFGLPVMLEKPPASYSFLTPFIHIPNTKWIDNHKDIFTLNIEAATTLHTLDIHLDYFLHLATHIEDQDLPPKFQGANVENEFKSSILAISNAKAEALIKFFPLIMNKLIKLLVRPPVVAGSQMLNIGQTIFETVVSVLHKLQPVLGDGRSPLLTTFIHYQCLFPHPDIIPTKPDNFNSLGGNNPGVVEHSRNHHGSSHVRSMSNPSVSIENDLPSPTPSPFERTLSLRSPASPTNQSGSNVYLVNGTYVPCLRKLFHEEVLLQWVVLSGPAKELTLYNAWFFFELIVKSATENLAITRGLEVPRKNRFSEQFKDDLSTLVSSFSSELADRLLRDSRDMKLIHALNNSLAFFIRDLWSIADRGFVFLLIKTYFRHFTVHNEEMENYVDLVSIQIDFLRIICSYEHFVTLNLPFNTPLFPSTSFSRSSSFGSLASQNSIFSTLTLLDKIGSFAEVSEDYRQQHFLTGLLLSTIMSALGTSKSYLHYKAVSLLRCILTQHDWDPRFAEKSVKTRIAALYLPLLSMTLDMLPQLSDVKGDANSNKFSTLRRKADKSQATPASNAKEADGDQKADHIDNSVASAIAGSLVYSKTGAAFSMSTEAKAGMFKEDITKDLLICVLWVLKNLSASLLQRWLSELSMHKISQLVEVLYLCVSYFEYKGRDAWEKQNPTLLKKSSNLKTKLEDAILGLGSARRELLLRRRDRNGVSQSFNHCDNLRFRKDHFQQMRYSNGVLVSEKLQADDAAEINLDANLCSECVMIMLDVVENIVLVLYQDTDSSSDYFKQAQNVAVNILQLLIHALSLNQSTMALKSLFSTQRSLLLKFPSLIFEERCEIELCTELCLQLLRHCSSCISEVRSQASASLYFLMRQNCTVSSNFARIKMQVTMSLSSLVGTNQYFNEKFLRRSLKTILVYAVVDRDFQESNFPEQVQELVFNLHMILSDTIRMKEYQQDPEMLVDLMYRIAKGYQHSPDLRLTWLENMAQKHVERENFAEAAHCYIHSAAMVAEFMYIMKPKTHLPVSCVAFQKISANILEESMVSSEIPKDSEALCTGKFASEAGLISLLEKAASAFLTAQMFEAVNEVYKLLLPILEAHRNYSKLAAIHGKLQEVFTKIEHLAGKRVFGTYFRVGFFGSKFGDLDGEEFVYKEPFLTKLPEIASRLESFYSDQFGRDYVEVVKDSNPVDVNKLNPEKAYLQITYVEPYFDTWELEQRQTFFEKNYNIRRFVFSTPFTPDGRAHGELHEQYKRKTVLTTVNSFPYVKTRIQVQDRRQFVLIPIEVAIDDIQKKTRELHTVTLQSPVDPKILQMVLQGCIGTTVNQGPLEVANVFLSDAGRLPQERPPSPLQNKLRSAFKDFCRKCGDALRKNRSLISAEQREYQRELERNYYKFTERLAPMISNGPGAVKALRETYWHTSSNVRLKTSPLV